MSAHPVEHRTWDDIVSDYVMRPKRPTPRHRRDRHRRADLAAHGVRILDNVRANLRAAVRGTGTPAGGLALLVNLQRHDGRPS